MTDKQIEQRIAEANAEHCMKLGCEGILHLHAQTWTAENIKYFVSDREIELLNYKIKNK